MKHSALPADSLQLKVYARGLPGPIKVEVELRLPIQVQDFSDELPRPIHAGTWGRNRLDGHPVSRDLYVSGLGIGLAEGREDSGVLPGSQDGEGKRGSDLDEIPGEGGIGHVRENQLLRTPGSNQGLELLLDVGARA